jgi:hypothetical protein
MFHPMLILFCFVFNHFLRSRSLSRRVGSHLIRMPKEVPNDYFKYSDPTPFACACIACESEDSMTAAVTEALE